MGKVSLVGEIEVGGFEFFDTREPVGICGWRGNEFGWPGVVGGGEGGVDEPVDWIGQGGACEGWEVTVIGDSRVGKDNGEAIPGFD